MSTTVQDFRERMEDKQSVYKTEVLGIKQMGPGRSGFYPHILPEDSWSLNLWDDISYDVIQWFAQSGINWHAQKHNMLSSQVMCVNIFYPLRRRLDLLKPWLTRRFDVKNVIDLDFEYIGSDDFFNEGGGRGWKRTSSDLAITWEDKDKRRNMLLVEFKFTERSFGECRQDKNPERRRCLSSRAVVRSPRSQCYRARRGRTYWSYILSSESPILTDRLRAMRYCPFRYDFYQLMRNQLLAHAIENDSRPAFNAVDFGVMYHSDNEELLRMDHPFAGESHPLRAWASMLKNPDTFHSFTVQDFMQSIDANLPDDLAGWRSYLSERYGI